MFKSFDSFGDISCYFITLILTVLGQGQTWSGTFLLKQFLCNINWFRKMKYEAVYMSEQQHVITEVVDISFFQQHEKLYYLIVQQHVGAWVGWDVVLCLLVQQYVGAWVGWDVVLYRVAAIFPEHFQSFTVTLKKYLFKILLPQNNLSYLLKHK